MFLFSDLGGPGGQSGRAGAHRPRTQIRSAQVGTAPHTTHRTPFGITCPKLFEKDLKIPLAQQGFSGNRRACAYNSPQIHNGLVEERFG